MEQWIQKTEIYKGPIFSVESGIVELADGSIVERQVVRHQGSVAIVAILDDGIIFVRQPRIAVSKEVLEIPAGRIENGEDPKIAALRELAEETGYQALKLIPGPVYYSSVGFLDEHVHLFLAVDLHLVKVDDRKEGVMPDKKQEVKKDEGLSQLLLSVAEVEKKLAAHGFEDSKTIIGLQHALDYIKKRESPLDHRTLYGWYADENHKYNTLIWQFPAAIIALNILAIDKLGTGSLLLVAMFLINLVLLYCVAKHVWHQKKFTDALKVINKDFIENYEDLPVAKFDGPHFFKLPAGRVLVWSLAVFNLAYLIIALFRQL